MKRYSRFNFSHNDCYIKFLFGVSGVDTIDIYVSKEDALLHHYILIGYEDGIKAVHEFKKDFKNNVI